MRFADLNKELRHLHEQGDLLDRARSRSWVVGRGDHRLMLNIRIQAFGADDVSILMSAHKWRTDPDAGCIVEGVEYKGGYFDYVHNPLEQLSSRQLHYVQSAKFYVERYVEGSVEALPTHAPDHLVAPSP